MSLLLPHRQLLLPKKPFLVGVTTQVATSSPITLTLPARQAGILLVAGIARHAGGSATPGTPTGWTVLAQSTADPEYRFVFRFCDGTEAPTTTSAAASATSLSAIVFAFSGVHSTRLPVVGGTNTGTSATPGAGTATYAERGRPWMWLQWIMWNGDGSLVSVPLKYTIRPTSVRDGVNGGQAMVARYGEANEPAVTFSISASLLWAANVHSVDGFA